MTKKQIEEQMTQLLKASSVSVGEFRRIFGKVMVDYEQEIGWPETDKGKPWTDAELRVVLSDAPTKENCVKHAKAFGRGYGALEQIYRRAATTDPEIKRLRPKDKFIAQIKRVSKELGWRA
ncbi:MAG: hypothetical protein AB7V18_08300 [Pyrinomonadaceae bacterium]